eukprot:m.117481 g.117481  ORF g.117481 m.117481 type:complete len:509 (-) comp9518_c0_seq2:56-1582(-)
MALRTRVALLRALRGRHCSSAAGELSNEPPAVLPFALTPEEAREAIRNWTPWIAPASVRAQLAERPLERRLLPFYAASATVHSRFRGEVGYASYVSNYSTREKMFATRRVLRYEPKGWHDMGDTAYSPKLPMMQVYASFEYRRQNVQAIKSDLLDHCVALAPGIVPEDTGVDPFSMVPSFARSLVTLRIQRDQVARASGWLRQEYTADDVRDIDLQLVENHLTLTPVYLPAYVLEYRHSGRVFRVFVNGIDGRIGGQRLWSGWTFGGLAALGAAVPSYLLDIDIAGGATWVAAAGLVAGAIAHWKPTLTQMYYDRLRDQELTNNATEATLQTMQHAQDQAAQIAEENAEFATASEQVQLASDEARRHDPKQYYKTLKLDHLCHQASLKQIKQAFRREALLWAPQVHANAPSERRLQAAVRHRRILEAYAVLRDPARRAKYDAVGLKKKAEEDSKQAAEEEKKKAAEEEKKKATEEGRRKAAEKKAQLSSAAPAAPKQPQPTPAQKQMP